MSDELTATLRAFYEMFDQRDKSALLAYFHPDAVLHDHRHMASWGGAPEEWAEMVEGWWSLIPDSQVEEVKVLRSEPGRHLHYVVFGGRDSVTGGRAEFEFFAVSTLRDGLVATTDFFDDEASATEHFDRSGA